MKGEYKMSRIEKAVIEASKEGEIGMKENKYEYYTVLAQRHIDIEYPKYEVIKFKVRGISHIQHHPGSTTIQGIGKSAQIKIDQYRKDGYTLYTIVGDRTVTLNN
jgi:hypothetical protein